ncbi:MAG: serine/threonine-protein kinase [Anaerolineae bacterium]
MAELNLVGKTLGSYQILAEIGRGGMAVVYRAYQPSLNREVAIKVLPPQFTFDQQFIQRFVREAQTAARLRHRHIIVIHDVAEQDGLHYIVMDFLQGRTLRQLIEEEGALPPARVARIVEQIASALDYAHRRNFVHRDVKPDNIFVDQGDQVTLTDFGIAKAASGTQLTRTGMLVGTPQYMSPEQARGDAVGPAADIYALGIVAYQMLSGRVPFQGTTPHAILYQQIHELPPPLGSVRSGLLPAVDSVLNAALAKEPRARYASAGQFAQALATTVASGAPVPPPPPPAKPTTPEPERAEPGRDGRLLWLLGLAIVAVAAVVVVAILLLGGGRSQVDTAATEQALAALQATQTAQVLPTITQPQPTETPPSATTQAPLTDTPPPTGTDVLSTDTPVTPTDTPVTPTDTPVPPTRTPTPTCGLPTDPSLAPVWERGRLGCPSAASAIVWAAWEPFEHGYMLWRSDTDNVYVFSLQDGTNLSTGTWQLRTETWPGDEGGGLSPPPGLYEPVRGFGWLWRTYLGGPDGALGWAREDEKGFCANIQPFESGLIFGSSTVTYCQDQLYNWATHPSFTPLLFALYGDGIWRRY